MKQETATTWNKFDEAAFIEGVCDGKEEVLFVDRPLEAHENTGFSFGVKAGQAFAACFKVGEHLNVRCCYLADGEAPDPAYEWLVGLWTAFQDQNRKGFPA